ncbi:MAG: hypothetical protein AB2L14_34110 [Candidatus Xenobiia bacterium LiM19]
MDIFLELKKAGLLDEDNIVDRQTVVDLLSIINNSDTIDQERIVTILTSTIASFNGQTRLIHLEEALNH